VAKIYKTITRFGSFQGCLYSHAEFRTPRSCASIIGVPGFDKGDTKRWSEVKVDLEVKDHRIALKGLHFACAPVHSDGGSSGINRRNHNPEKWRRLGFQTESPAWEFGDVGFLGMMDLTDYVRKDEDRFKKLLAEQNAKSPIQRCPIARASLAVSSLLYHQFGVHKSDIHDPKTFQVLESRSNFDRAFRPLLLQWSRLHTATLSAFLKLWQDAQAEIEDFDRVAELVRVLIYHVIGLAHRTKGVQDVEEDIMQMDCVRLRGLQMEILEQTYENAWGSHLSRHVREELNSEAMQFVKEQRIRCLLQGAWFPVSAPLRQRSAKIHIETIPWRYVRLSHNRRYLHYCDYENETSYEPKLEELPEKLDLSIVSSVVSNVTPASLSSTCSISGTPTPTIGGSRLGSTKIIIHGYSPISSSTSNHNQEEILLTLHPQTHSSASEWLDGLLMLLNQPPITSETSKLVKMVMNYGLKIRLLNVRYTDDYHKSMPELPCREDVDEDYFYSLFV